jgi:coproporphyrinogen III oxidase
MARMRLLCAEVPPEEKMIDIEPVTTYFAELQDTVCQAIGDFDGGDGFSSEDIYPPGGGRSRPRLLEAGAVIEKGAVQFTWSIGASLPPAATERNPELAGRGFQAAAISLIQHPRNPYQPTMHANLRFFLVDDTHWYFGGGFDLTPYYPFEEDVVHWHQAARKACLPFGDEVYPRCKAACDEYFYLSHRNEARGVGGLFFDDWTEGGFDRSFDFVRSIGDQILPAYMPILERHRDHPYTERERDFQSYRRGRYAEFNLAIDRGTRYGLQSGRRIESVLASLPPVASWRYNWQPDAGTPEALLYERYLKPQDWLGVI